MIWEFDTNQDFTTLNGVRASGGAIQGPAPTVAGGMLYLNAGYGDHLGRAGQRAARLRTAVSGGGSSDPPSAVGSKTDATPITLFRW